MLVLDGLLVHWDDGFGYRWAVAQVAVLPDRIGLTQPLLDVDPSLPGRGKYPAVEEFMPQACCATLICLAASPIVIP